MSRSGLAGSFTVLLLASATPGLAAREDMVDTADTVLRACGERALPRDMVSTCLERARLVNEQTPSPALQDLQSRLEQRARTEPGSDLMPPSRPSGDRVYSQPLPGEGAAPTPGPSMAPYDQGPPPQNEGDDEDGYDNGPPDNGPPDNGGYDNRGYDNRGYDNRGYDNDRGGPPQAAPDEDGPPQAAPYDDSDEPPIEGEDDGYDNSQPDPGYDMPDPPDPNWPPPGGGYDDGTGN